MKPNFCRRLERLTKLRQCTDADDAAREAQKSQMSLDGALKAYTQLAEGREPRTCALHHPAVTTEAIIALNASARNAILDVPTLDVVSTTCKVVTLVGV